jgi:hypothetical protein
MIVTTPHALVRAGADQVCGFSRICRYAEA